MTNLQQRLQMLGKSILENALPLKLVVGAILGIVTGPGLLGFLSEYATYRYSLYYGFRPPLEGIPYLRAAVTLGSFILLFLGALLFILSLWLARRIAAHFSTMPFVASGTSTTREERLRNFRLLPFKKVAPRALLAALFFSLLGILNAGLVAIIDDVDIRDLLVNPSLLFVYGFVSTLLAWRPQAAWWFAAISTTVVVISLLVLMFYPPAYADFLRAIGYGGGIRIEIEAKDNDEKSELVSGFLLLRSGAAVILLDESSQVIREIPFSEVKNLRHPAVPFRKMQFKLPLADNS